MTKYKKNKTKKIYGSKKNKTKKIYGGKKK
uniref:Uncharacterized protein n=1 Tax=viral metagenome TaxID=1070528 RepID=A0A6C0KV92_9ZZZZ